MQRVSFKNFGGAEQLVAETTTELRPAADQVLVDVEAAGVNYLDVYQRKGLSNVPLPHTPGLEGVGRIRTLGPDLAAKGAGLIVGQRVAWVNVPASYASEILIPASRAIAPVRCGDSACIG